MEIENSISSSKKHPSEAREATQGSGRKHVILFFSFEVRKIFQTKYYSKHKFCVFRLFVFWGHQFWQEKGPIKQFFFIFYGIHVKFPLIWYQTCFGFFSFEVKKNFQTKYYSKEKNPETFLGLPGLTVSDKMGKNLVFTRKFNVIL